MPVDFSTWTQSRSLPSIGTNTGAPDLPFQKWRHFKEAFAPELVARAVSESSIPVGRCLDPFGGSGTTALACQFLGIQPVTIEINPYLADLIRSKLETYDPDAVARDLGRVLRLAVRLRGSVSLPLTASAPATMIEPGVGNRWIFDTSVAERLGALMAAIQSLEELKHQRLFRVLLGGILVDVSNVVVNGKGRRYRKRWKTRRRKPEDVEKLFGESVRRAVQDVHRFGNRACLTSKVIQGDARETVNDAPVSDIAVLSPPYPNSFDYTDVYNLELWVLGYLRDRSANRALRQSTLSSHVQINRSFAPAPPGSKILAHTLDCLHRSSESLWDRRLPKMIGAYFADMVDVLSAMRHVLMPNALVWLVVGDSRYADVLIPTGTILTELSRTVGYEEVLVESIRSMRSSAQQGGRRELAESLLVLKVT